MSIPRPALLAAAVLLVVLNAAPQSAHASDAFTIPAALSANAVTSCSDVTMSGGTIDSQGVSSASPTNAGHVATNGNLTLSGSSVIQGNATVGPGKHVTTTGSAHVTGSTTVATASFDCKPIDLVALATTLKTSNDNGRMPLTAQGKHALSGTTFTMSGTDTLTIPAGTYYFTSLSVSGSAIIALGGSVHILVDGPVNMSGGSVAAGANGFALHFWSSGASFDLSSGTFKGFVYAPSAKVNFSNGLLVGGVFANLVSLSGSAHLTRLIDDVPPHITITSPADGTGTSDPAHVLIKGTAADGETDVTVKVNGQPAAIAADGTWQVTLDLSAGSSPATVTAIATDAVGNTATASIHVVTAPPVISLTTPAPGSLLAARIVNLSGAAGDATTLTVNGTSAAIAGGVWTLGNVDLGADGAHSLNITGTNAAGATTILPLLTTDTTPPTITASVAPTPNAAGWNKNAVTVSFTCADATSGVATCPAPVVVSAETASQVVNGTATDKAGNQKSTSVTVKLDVTAPAMAITSPANGTSTVDPSITISGTVSDALSGVAVVTCNGVPATISGGTFTCTVTLAAGDNAITATVTDVAGNTASDTRNVTLATLTSIAVTPSSASVLVGATVGLTATATYSNGATRDVTALAAWSSSAAGVATVNAGMVTGVADGSATISATVSSVSGTITVTVTRPVTLVSIAVTPASASLTTGQTLQLTASATYSDNSTRDVTGQATWTTSASAVATVGSTGLVTATGTGSAVITATLASQSGATTIIVGPSEPLPPDPATVAPPIDATQSASVGDSTRFLYEGTNPIQTGVAANTIDPLRAAVIRGQVLQRGGTPLPGVAITILGHGEFGRTLTRADGRFDCAVNSGAAVTVQYRKDGYLPVDRIVATMANDYATAADVIMVPLDPAVTSVDLTAPGVKIARGSRSVDSSGSRAATILFPPGTSATMTLPDGSTQTIANLSIRTTEYTVGNDGPRAMPAPLPPQSAYTYCVELSADEAVTAGATRLDFSTTPSFYVENFLNFPVGGAVPVGYYDRAKGAWIASPDGRVVKIVAVIDGRAYLDVTGDGLADDSDAQIGTTPQERDTLATLYPVGQSLWRIPVTHFTPFDFNWPLALPADATTPNGRPTDFPCEECDPQTVSQTVAIPGAMSDAPGTPPPVLHYRSDRSPGRIASRVLDVPVSDTSVPRSLVRIDAEISVAGTFTRQTFSPAPNQHFRFTWDGRDAYGRTVQGAAPVSVRTIYFYSGTYEQPANRDASFGLASGVSQGIPSRELVTTSTVWTGQLGTWDAAGERLGGFTLSAHHFYDVTSKTLYRGDGSFTTDRPVLFGDTSGVVSTIAGNGTNDPTWSSAGGPAFNKPLGIVNALAVGPDGSLYLSSDQYVHRITPAGILERVAGGGTTPFPDIATKPALDAHLALPRGMAFGADGSLYLADQFNYIVRRIAPDGTTSRFAGTGVNGLGPDGVTATSSALGRPVDVAVGVDGSVYIVDQAGKVRRVAPDGMINTIAGADANETTGDGGPATDAHFQRPAAVRVAADGTVYVVDTDANRIRRIAPDGVITTYAGTGAPASTGDGGPATLASLKLYDTDGSLLAMGSDGSLIFIEPYASKIRRIDQVGVITTVAGTTMSASAPDGAAPAIATTIDTPQAVAVAPDGTIYFTEYNSLFIRKIAPALPSPTSAQGELMIGDGPAVHVFDRGGRHLRTLNADTGAVLYQFQYDAHGLVISMTDADGNLTTIERNASGDATAIVAPGSQRTAISPSSTSTTITTAPGEQRSFNYASGGLLTSTTDPRGNVTSFQFNDLGMETGETDAEQGTMTLSRTETGSGSNAVAVTTAEGRTLSLAVNTSAAGDVTNSSTIAGLTFTMTQAKNGVVTTLSPDGTASNTRVVGDPIWGMQSPYSAESTVTWPSGRTLTVTRQRQAALADAANRFSLSSRTDTLTFAGKTYTRVFNRGSLTETVTTPLHRAISRTFDLAGRTTSYTLPGVAATVFAYDSHGRLSTVTQASRQQTLGYNDRNELTSITDALQRTTRYEYDGAGRVQKQILPDAREINFLYDPAGNLTAVTPPSRPQHGFEYTKVNLMNRYTPPALSEAGAISYVYDKDRNLTAIMRPDGVTISLTHDGVGRLATLSWPAHALGYHYLGGGLLGSIDGADASLAYTYDGSLPLSMSWSGAVTESVSWTYDPSLRLASETAAGQPVSFGYNDDGQMTAAGDLQIFYESNGLLGAADLGTNGATEDWFSFNEYGEQRERGIYYAGSDQLVFVYDRDNVGRITQITNYDTFRHQNLLGQVGYGYDAAGRLTDVTSSSSSVHYEYDANGNRTSRQVSTAESTTTETASYDAQDRLLTYGAAQYSYNQNGELMTKTEPTGVTQYEYDPLGNLRRVTLPSGTVIDYVIDAQNRRVGRKVNGILVRQWLYGDQLRIVAELDGSGTPVSRFVYGLRRNVPDYMVRGGETYRIFSDHLGSPRFVVNAATSAVIETRTYDEFGNLLSDSNPGFQPFGFAGGLYDQDTKLVRFGARDYDPAVGRWTAKDPVGFNAGDANLYAYAWADPINYIDSSGTSGYIAIFSATDTTEGSSSDLSRGHSWISYTPDDPSSTSGQGPTTTYSTWSGMNTRGMPYGLNEDAEERVGPYQPTAARFAHIDDAAEQRLMAMIAHYRKKGWNWKWPCSAFAHDAWQAATGEDLYHRYDGYSNPTSLDQGIRKANRGRPFWVKGY